MVNDTSFSARRSWPRTVYVTSRCSTSTAAGAAADGPAAAVSLVCRHDDSTCSIESVTRLIATTREAMARAGNSVIHQYPAPSVT